MNIYAHSVEGQPTDSWEPLDKHLQNVARVAGQNATFFGAENFAQLAGCLHDLGKLKPEFQAKLHGAKNKVGHSAEGARYAAEHLGNPGKILAYCIAGHHAGLANGLLTMRNCASSASKPTTPLNERIAQASQTALPGWLHLPELKPPAPFTGLNEANSLFALQFLTRMLFSALVDADFIETEKFYTPEIEREWQGELTQLAEKLEVSLARFKTPEPEDTLNSLRAEILQEAGSKALLRGSVANFGSGLKS